eukprot:Phypoly_transcript_10725.p1 GENE.Phypoly_transcript_10725~~Phypoly_transcript_10725.p1  ORF type:complete len:360 (+),score=30.94 Phypoly_transcript_10725:96-1175(+)
MMGHKYLDNSWTGEEAYDWRAEFLPVLTGVSLSLCILAQVLFYTFARFRIFPRSLLSWLNLYNIYYCVFQQFRWFQSPWHAAMTDYPAGSLICRFNTFLDLSSVTGQYTCSALLCISIFLMVVHQIELEKKKGYYLAFWSIAALVPFILSIPAMFVPVKKIPGGPCVIGNYLANIFLRAPFIVALIADVFLVGWTMRHIREVYNSVKKNTNVNLPIRYIFVRFIAAFITQLFTVLPVEVLFGFPDKTYHSAIYTRFALVARTTGPSVDAILMIIGNSEFTSWVGQKMAFLQMCANLAWLAQFRKKRAEHELKQEQKTDINAAVILTIEEVDQAAYDKNHTLYSGEFSSAAMDSAISTDE